MDKKKKKMKKKLMIRMILEFHLKEMRKAIKEMRDQRKKNHLN